MLNEYKQRSASLCSAALSLGLTLMHLFSARVYSFWPWEQRSPQLIHCRANSGAGDSNGSLCVGNATVCWWTFTVIQHYYVSNIIYGLIQSQFYNWIIATYLHLEKKSQWKFPLWRTSSGIKCWANQDCFLKLKSGPPGLVNNQNSSLLSDCIHFCNLFAIFLPWFSQMCTGYLPSSFQNSGALGKPTTL